MGLHTLGISGLPIITGNREPFVQSIINQDRHLIIIKVLAEFNGIVGPGMCEALWFYAGRKGHTGSSEVECGYTPH